MHNAAELIREVKYIFFYLLGRETNINFVFEENFLNPTVNGKSSIYSEH